MVMEFGYLGEPPLCADRLEAVTYWRRLEGLFFALAAMATPEPGVQSAHYFVWHVFGSNTVPSFHQRSQE
jgi:hypothetical protein